MAYANPRYGYHHAQTEGAISSTRPLYFEEDDSAILDPAILDADNMQSPVDAQLRKGSFANSNGVLSPAESHGWDHQYSNGLALESTSAGASNPFHEEHNGYLRHGPAPVPTFAHPHHHQGWSFEHGSGHCTPTTGVEFIPQPPQQSFEGHQTVQYTHHRTDSARGSFSHHGPHPPAQPQHYNAPHPEGTFIAAPQVQTPMSPHSHQDWMSMAQQEVECRPMSKRMRPASPLRTSVDSQRGDGIRKKNGRIDIPNERTIQTIDDLIESTNDDELLKELKQQKRLLRNREAALASRQRKKKHTEDLETQQKDFSRTINGLESQIQALELEHHNQERNHQMILHRYQDAQRMIDTLHDEKRDMVMKHTEETSNLRRRIHILTDQLEAGPAPAMSAAPSSTGFTDFNAEMEALNMGPHDWDNFIFVNELQNDQSDDFTFDSKPEPIRQSPVLEKKSSSNTVVHSSPKKIAENTAEQPVASGLLFFLLLCGAFVASKPANSRPSDLPEVPEDVRAAAPAVLNGLLAEAGQSSSPSNSRSTQYTGLEPASSGLAQSTRPRSRLEHVHHRITSPTKQQQIDSAFSLTTAQYASLTNMNYNEHAGSSHRADTSPRPRRNLAEALTNAPEGNAQNSKAEVYTRSLLWDQIPADVVKQFKELVRDHHEIETRQRQQRSTHDDMFAYKVEN
ncbi:hypothetical protein LTR37_002626 [Vermiconidia calcicola]|uniref:Uncharacterized protein n=1 Tax=Vermiconidia calcicola TaxID=1690605 RepID=A0ACC3NSL5_9PEZI|nr:hypothetical protein LTR37_002626 [Vermiconidia calcicola]